MSFTIEPIGIIRTPFLEPAGTPIQPSRADRAPGRVILAPPFHAGLLHLDGFDRIWLLYWLHRASAPQLVVKPFLDDHPHGVFATRSPARPSPLGLSAVRLLAVREGELDVEGVDMLDGSPLLDIKPYVPEFDSYPDSRAGWFDHSRSPRRLADNRFAGDPPA